jgi:hypothetical protein
MKIRVFRRWRSGDALLRRAHADATKDSCDSADVIDNIALAKQV